MPHLSSAQPKHLYRFVAARQFNNSSMIYTKRRFAAELLAELERDLAEAEPPFSVVRLARWASTKFLKYQGRLEDGLYDSIMTIELMEEGPEFELDIDQIRALAEEILCPVKLKST